MRERSKLLLLETENHFCMVVPEVNENEEIECDQSNVEANIPVTSSHSYLPLAYFPMQTAAIGTQNFNLPFDTSICLFHILFTRLDWIFRKQVRLKRFYHAFGSALKIF